MTMAAASRPEGYRSYLITLARVHLARAGPVRNKVEASDLVQDVLLRAHEVRRQFRGTMTNEYRAWLQQILKTKLADAQRHHGRQKRDIVREWSIEDSANNMGELAADLTSPSQRLAKREGILRLAEALTALPDDQRTAVELRYIRDLSLADIAGLMSRSKPGVAGLLRRGLLFHPAYRRGVAAVDLVDADRFGPIAESDHAAELNPSDLLWEPADDYRDPVGAALEEYRGRWIAGFAPVGNTRFVVIVQQRYKEALKLDPSLWRNLVAWSALVIGLAMAILVVILRCTRSNT